MGGALILVSIALSTLLWSDLSNHYVWVTLLVTMYSTAQLVGWTTTAKFLERTPLGLPARWKLFWQTAIGLGAAISLYYTAFSAVETSYIVPFFKDVSIDVGILYIAVSCFIIVGFSNAVNLTDGLDGLAILPTVMVGGALGVIAYLAGHTVLSAYLNIPYVVGSGEMVVFAGALVGSGLGFLWFNTYPAQVFHGRRWVAFALGAALAD